MGRQTRRGRAVDEASHVEEEQSPVAATSATVAIAFTPAPASQSPNLRRTNDDRAAAAYYRAIVVTFASIRRWNPEVELVLVSDVDAPEPFAGELRSINARTELVPFAHRPPQNFWPIFNASLYSIDALQALAESSGAGHRLLLLDPDIVCVGNLDPVLQGISGGTWLAYPIGIPQNEKSQGLSAIEAVELHLALDPTLTEPPVHYGGEIYGFTPEGATPVLERAEAAWELALQNWKERRPHFVTEEHLLNYALRTVSIVDASNIIRRIWTTPVYRTVSGGESDLLLWHLPAEKDRGMLALHREATDRASWFWRADRDEFIRQVGKIVGIPRRLPRRWAYDVSGSAVRALQRRLNKRMSRRAA